MTDAVYALLSASVMGKKLNESVFTRPGGNRVRDFGDTW